MKTLFSLLLLIPSLSWGCLDDLEDYINSDDMIELVVYSKDKMDLYINNIRNFKAINITVGLPFIRISPDHGPNSIMQGKNRSDPSSFFYAMRFIQKLK